MLIPFFCHSYSQCTDMQTSCFTGPVVVYFQMNICKATYHQIAYHQHGYHVPNSYFNRTTAVQPFTKRQITPLKHLLQTTHWSVDTIPKITRIDKMFISIYLSTLQRQLNIKGYQCSTNLEFVLFKHNVKNVSDVTIIVLSYITVHSSSVAIRCETRFHKVL